ncbi:MAG: NtaA/DmoA family FMN-dependent monooxygenase [Gordonia sp. (in: high G+C Gram-positive bacteria)]
MTELKQIGLYLFEMNTISQYSLGEWRLPGDKRTTYTSLGFWRELSEILEEGRFDGLFLADIVGIHDVFRGSFDSAATEGTQFPNNDPFTLAASVLALTEHLSVGITASTSYSHPFELARRFSTLDHLSDGRIGWNIVLSHTENSSTNFGLDHQLEHDRRYDKAEEFLEVVFKLWEGSWDDNAVIADRERGIYADPRGIRYIDHHGEFFNVRGPHLSQPSVQRTPVLYQATASQRGYDFVAKNVEYVFTSGPNPAKVAENIKYTKQRAIEFGRAPEDVKSIVIVDVIVGRDDDEVARKISEIQRVASLAGKLTKGDSPIDYLAFSDETSLEEVLRLSGFDTQSYRDGSALPPLLPGLTLDHTIADAKKRIRASHFSTFFAAGTPEVVADTIEEWADVYGVDAINLRPHHAFDSVRDFVELVVPELQRRGRLRTEYDKSTLRERAFGPGNARLNDRHPGARYRQSVVSR